MRRWLMCPVANGDVTIPLQKGQAYTYSAWVIAGANGVVVFFLLLVCERTADAMSAARISKGYVE